MLDDEIVILNYTRSSSDKFVVIDTKSMEIKKENIIDRPRKIKKSNNYIYISNRSIDKPTIYKFDSNYNEVERVIFNYSISDFDLNDKIMYVLLDNNTIAKVDINSLEIIEYIDITYDYDNNKRPRLINVFK